MSTGTIERKRTKKSRKASGTVCDADYRSVRRNGKKGGCTNVADLDFAQPERRGDESLGVNETIDDSLCRSLQSLERQRRFALKQRIRGENAITAFVASSAFGYHSGLEEKERMKLWQQAGRMVREIDELGSATDICGVDDVSDETYHDSDPRCVAGIVNISRISRQAWKDYEAALLKEMVELAKQLPVASWFDHPDRKGIGLTMLATIVGEAGNLSNYPNPAKLWKRLFGAPITKDGETKMPSHWRRTKGGLTAEEWEEAGYSPGRNATQYPLRENIVKQNGDGPYRRRYDEGRERAAKAHPDWTKGHLHAHGQLLAAKLLVKDLWNEWHDGEFDTDKPSVP